MHAHHIEDASNHPDIRFSVKNGKCLCRKHHTWLHILYKQGYRKKTTKKDYKYYKSLYKAIERETKKKIV
jgi:hypothetical protein